MIHARAGELQIVFSDDRRAARFEICADEPTAAINLLEMAIGAICAAAKANGSKIETIREIIADAFERSHEVPEAQA